MPYTSSANELVLDQPLPHSARRQAPEGHQALWHRHPMDEASGSRLRPNPHQVLAQDVGPERRVYQSHDLPFVSISVTSLGTWLTDQARPFPRDW